MVIIADKGWSNSINHHQKDVLFSWGMIISYGSTADSRWLPGRARPWNTWPMPLPVKRCLSPAGADQYQQDPSSHRDGFPRFHGLKGTSTGFAKCRAFRLTFCLRPILWRFELFWILWVFGTVPSQTVNELSRTREVGTKVSADAYLAHQRIWGSPKFCEHSGMKKKNDTQLSQLDFLCAFGARWIPNVTQCHPLKLLFGASRNFLLWLSWSKSWTGEFWVTQLDELRFLKFCGMHCWKAIRE